MQFIKIDDSKEQSIIEQLQSQINGEISVSNGEELLTFHNELGTGRMRSMILNRGISLFDIDAIFEKNVKLIFRSSTQSKSFQFIFISEGCIEFSDSADKNHKTLDRFQNIIFGHHSLNAHQSNFLVPEFSRIKLNMISVLDD